MRLRTPEFARTGLQTPVLFIMFNRPDYVRKSLEILREVRPSRLYVVSDGPRTQQEGEDRLVQECREYIEWVDWPCMIKKNYARHNLNCGIRPASGMHWIFRHEPQAIMLEDDLRPDPSFFSFCENMLNRYKDHPEIMHVSGRNNLGNVPSPSSYFFARTINPWGWASWARAWKHYDFAFRHWKTVNVTQYRTLLQDDQQAEYYAYNEKKYEGRLLDTWDIQWIYSVYRNHGFSIIPTVNLVENEGFHQRGTHTQIDYDIRAELPAYGMEEPVRHPDAIEYGEIGRLFDRENFLLEQMAGLVNPKILSTIYRSWQQADPGVREVIGERYKDVIPYLYPFSNPGESLRILEKVQPHLPSGDFLDKLLHFFSSQVKAQS